MHLVKDFKSMSRRQRIMTAIMFAAIAFYVFSCVVGLPWADPVKGADQIQKVLGKMIDVVKLVFQAVGIILSIYSVGQLVLAFKNEDADSKSRASTMLVVGVALIALPSMVDSLGLFENFGDF